MQLRIDGRNVSPQPGESLLEMIKRLGLESDYLSKRPLAAKIAGEVFTLNYIPLREKDVSPERSSIRRAMAASGGEVRLLRYGDEAGKEAYIRTAQFVIFLALRRLWPDAVARMTCTLGASVFIEVTQEERISVATLKEEVARLIAADIPLHRRRVPLQQAVDRFTREGQEDKARLLSWRSAEYFDE